jgi:predicted transcriptional regulator
MAHVGRESLRTAESTLREAGFTVSEECRSRPSCFDIAARRGGSIILIKVQTDIGGLSTNDAVELKAISESFSARCLLIGEQAREKPLEDDTVYRRHDILSVTPRTFENIMLHDTHPLIQADPGGYYVEIDGEALKRRRQELGLSAGEVAEVVSTSRRTIYGYERGLAKASVTAAYNLLWTLGIPIAKSINVFDRPQKRPKSCMLATARLVFARNRILNRIFKRWTRCHVAAFKKAPFDFIVRASERKTMIIGGITNKKESYLDRRVNEILSVSKVAHAQPVLITEGHLQLEKGIPCISSEDASRIKNPEDLIASVD